MSKRKRRAIALVHEEARPPDTLEGLDAKAFLPVKGAYDVVRALERLEFDVEVVGVEDELRPIREAVQGPKPAIVFNLLEGFRGLPYLDQNIVAYLELMNVPYTGCNPRGLVLARDKALAKKILHYHRVPSPEFAVFPRGRRIRPSTKLEYPFIVKALADDASTGISQASVVTSREKLIERVEYLHEALGRDAIAERYIEGREVYLGLLGNHVLDALPLWEIDLAGLPDSAAKIATEKVKWDVGYQDRHKIETRRAKDVDEKIEKRAAQLAKRIFRNLGLAGYARIDFRLTDAGELYFLEANPNPDISKDEELAEAFQHRGGTYEELIAKIVRLGRRGSTGP